MGISGFYILKVVVEEGEVLMEIIREKRNCCALKGGEGRWVVRVGRDFSCEYLIREIVEFNAIKCQPLPSAEDKTVHFF